MSRAFSAQTRAPELTMLLSGARGSGKTVLLASIAEEAERIGSSLAQEELRSYVLESTYRDLSDGDVSFLKAMLPDEGQSLMKDVAARMGKSSSYASTYRERLLRQGVIGEPDRNAVGFELPGFREYFMERIGWRSTPMTPTE